VCGLLLVVASSRAAAANPADVVGMGARGAAMAGAQVATVDDSTGNYYNPAQLAAGDALRVDLGYQVALPHLSLGAGTVPVTPARGTVIGLSVPGRVLGRRVAIGAGLILPDQHLTRTRALPATRPRFVAYDNRTQRLFLAASAAVELTPSLRIGAGISYMSSTIGTVQLDGLVGFPDASASDLALAVDVDLRTIRYPQAGVTWDATPWLSLGASYRGGFRLQVDQTFHITGDVGAPGREPVVEDGFFVLRSVSQDLFQPEQVTAGFAAQLTPRALVAFDLCWQRWSAFEHPAARLTFDLDVGEFNDQVDLPPPARLPLPHLHDVAVPRLGLELAATPSLAVRAGYAFEPTVAPPQVGDSNFVDSDKHTLSLGLGKAWPGVGKIIQRPVALDGFVALTVLAPRDHAKLSPLDLVGSYRSSGVVLAAGLTSRWQF
jgi:long-chain fatty acid transport protein